MIVTPENLHNVIELLKKPGFYAIDTETTGLRPYHGHRLFSIIIADAEMEYYFNFQGYPAEGVEPLSRDTTLSLLQSVLGKASNTWMISNAKFDMAMLANEGLYIGGEIHDTEAMGRLEKNNRFKYSLDALAKELGHEKDSTVLEYIRAHNLYEYIMDDEGNKEKTPCFWKVPFSLIVPYACHDARLTYLVAEHQIDKFLQIDTDAAKLFMKPISPLVENEIRLTPVLFSMEQNGILIDREYVAAGLAREKGRAADLKKEFLDLTGEEFVDSSKKFTPIFDRLNIRYPFTETGTPSFTADFLEDLKHPLAKIIQGHRDALKRANTYYKNFLYYADANDRIHLSLRQGGTTTGRMSAAHPNLQNLTKRKDKGTEFPVRKSFVPTPGYFFGFLDLEAAEYKIFLECCKQLDLIELVKSGLDVHQATAQMMGVTRDQAKTLNFQILYGGGIAKLALALFGPTLPLETLKAIGRIHVYKMHSYAGRDQHLKLLEPLTIEELDTNLTELRKAYDLLELYFQKLPKAREFTKAVSRTAQERGYVVNLFGRRCYFTHGQSTHMSANHLIQGAVADIVKVGMVRIHKLLEGKKSRMSLMLHDELIFEIAYGEEYIFNEAKKNLEDSFNYKYLPVTCGAEWSKTNWAEKEKWNG